MVPNPAYKGPWVQKTLANPAYKGIWVAPDIPNPAFKDDKNLYAFKDLAAVGIELWQVKAGSLFDNILVTDDAAYATKMLDATWGKSKDGEKAMQEKAAAEESAKAAEAAKAAAAAEPEDDDEGDFEEEDEEDAAAAHDEL